jgi:hypothetical protein
MRELRGRLEQVLVEQFGVKPGRAEGES